ncbi:MAG: transposase [Flexilinea sp.]
MAAQMQIKQSETGKPAEITCPQGYSAVVEASNQKKGFVAHFDQEICQNCLFLEKCPVRKGKRDAKWHLRFYQDQINSSQRRRRSLHHQKEGHNLRAAVEAIVQEVKHSFPAGKLPVRGSFRVSCMVIGSAMMTNVRRIQRCLLVKKKQENKQNQASIGQNCLQKQSFFRFLFYKKSIFAIG